MILLYALLLLLLSDIVKIPCLLVMERTVPGMIMRLQFVIRKLNVQVSEDFTSSSIIISKDLKSILQLRKLVLQTKDDTTTTISI